jgi:ParB/RepB/Spo0J family partition protein
MQQAVFTEEATTYKPFLENIHESKFPLDEEIPGPAPKKSLIESIRRYGLWQPVGVVQITRGVHNIRMKPEQIGFGRRRIKAARAAGLQEIPTFIFPEGTPTTILTMTENHQRSDNRVADLEAVRHMVFEEYKSADDISRELGIPKNELNRVFKLISLPLPLREAFAAGYMGAGAAEKAAKLSLEHQGRLMELLAEKGKLTEDDVVAVQRVRQAEAAGELQSLFLPDTLGVGWRVEATSFARRAAEAIPPEHPKAETWRAQLEGIVSEIYEALG